MEKTESGTESRTLRRNASTACSPACVDPVCGAPKGTRTPGLLLRRQLLYPAELLAHACPYPGREREYGAGEGNRTHTTSLEGWDSTIELHPHFATAIIIAHDLYPVNKKGRFFLQNRPFPNKKNLKCKQCALTAKHAGQSRPPR